MRRAAPRRRGHELAKRGRVAEVPALQRVVKRDPERTGAASRFGVGRRRRRRFEIALELARLCVLAQPRGTREGGSGDAARERGGVRRARDGIPIRRGARQRLREPSRRGYAKRPSEHVARGGERPVLR